MADFPDETKEYVTIQLPPGAWHEGRNHFHGPVISKHNYKQPNEPGGKDCWYVEFIDDFWGYCYVKQDQDTPMELATFTFSGPMGTPLEGGPTNDTPS